MLRLSIIVNMYNTAKYMDRCMDTLLNQDIPLSDYEIIMVDDCSPDNSLEMANEYAAKYPNIKVLHHETNRGLAAGRNTGVDAAEGQYLRFVDPDDYVETNSFATLLKQMEDENLDVLRFDYQKVDEQYNPILHNHAERRLNLTPEVMTGKRFLAERLGVQCYVWPYIYRTDLIKNIYFIEDCFLDDAPWLPRVLMCTERMNCSPRKCQYYLIRQGSMVRNLSMMRRINGQLKVIELLREQVNNFRMQNEDVRLVEHWYDRMLCFSAFSIMEGLLKVDKENAKDIIKRLHELDCFPLRYEIYNKKVMILKQFFINISPMLYWRLMHK